MTTGLHDMARMTVTGTPGTGTITLGAAATGYQTFASSGVVDGEVVSYSIQDGNNWEVGHGTYTASGTTLSRGPIFSSNSNTAISATSSAQVFVTVLAEDITTDNLVAVGNTVGLTSSTSAILTNQTISGMGGVSVGFSSATILISASSMSSLSFFEPMIPAVSPLVSCSPATGGSIVIAPFVLNQPIVFNQFRFVVSYGLTLMTAASSSLSRSFSGSAASTQSIILYSAMGGTSSGSYTSFASAAVTLSVTQTISQSSSSMTNGLSLTWPVGTGTSSTNLSTTGVTSTLSVALNTSGFIGNRILDISILTTLQPGNYAVGLIGSTGSAGGAGPLSWSGTVVGQAVVNFLNLSGVPAERQFPGVGTTSTAAGFPATINIHSLGGPVAAAPVRMYFYMINA